LANTSRQVPTDSQAVSIGPLAASRAAVAGLGTPGAEHPPAGQAHTPVAAAMVATSPPGGHQQHFAGQHGVHALRGALRQKVRAPKQTLPWSATGSAAIDKIPRPGGPVTDHVPSTIIRDITRYGDAFDAWPGDRRSSSRPRPCGLLRSSCRTDRTHGYGWHDVLHDDGRGRRPDCIARCTTTRAASRRRTPCRTRNRHAGSSWCGRHPFGHAIRPCRLGDRTFLRTVSIRDSCCCPFGFKHPHGPARTAW